MSLWDAQTVFIQSEKTIPIETINIYLEEHHYRQPFSERAGIEVLRALGYKRPSTKRGPKTWIPTEGMGLKVSISVCLDAETVNRLPRIGRNEYIEKLLWKEWDKDKA